MLGYIDEHFYWDSSEGENGRLLTHSLERIADNLPFASGKQFSVKLFTKVVPEEDRGNAILPKDLIGLFKSYK